GTTWQGLFYVPALVVTAMAAVSHFAAKASPEDVLPAVKFGRKAGRRPPAASFGEKPAAWTIVKRLFSIPLFRQVLVFSFVIHILRSFFMVWVPKFMVDLGMANVKAGLTSAVFPLMGVLGTIALGWYTDRYAKDGDRTGAMWKMLVGLVFSLAAIALLIPYGLEHQAGIVLLLGASGLFLYGPYSMSSGCMSLDIAGPEGAGTCTGLIDGIGYIGGALASWGAGVVADRFGWTQVFWALAGFAAFTVAWTYHMSRSARRGTEESMMKGAAVAGLILACLGSASAFEVEGHRGARWVRPENTLAAFRYALEAGVDTLELDLHATKDDVLVVTHDPFLSPELCLGPNGERLTEKAWVRKLTLKELQRYDCGSLVNPRFKAQVAQPGERIPSFEELLAWLDTEENPRAKTVLLNVETKSEPEHPDWTPEPEPFTKLVLASVKKHKLGKRFVLQSFDYRTLEAAKKLSPKTTLSALVEFRPKEPLVELAKRLKADIVSPDHAWLTKEDVDALHAARVKVVPWTANDEAAWRKLDGYGVDGIISDDPKSLLEYRAKRN
ncbi:MAG: MFS transporter, partial [Elusimicrobia bacterium]|nr:MFS transporter [Elusimicrobiota bacterium]